MIGGFELSRWHAHQVAQAAAQDMREESARQDRADAYAFRCATIAPAVHEELELARAKVDVDAHRAAVAEQRAREERLSEFEEWQQHLLRTGAGRWRTVAEILQAEREVPC